MSVRWWKIILLAIVVLGLVARLVMSFSDRADTTLVTEWAVIVRYMLEGHFYSFNFSYPNGQPQPTAYMPPVYAWFCYIFVAPFGESLGVSLIKVVQSLLFIPIAYWLYEIARILFKPAVGWIAVSVFSLTPMMIYSPSQVSSVQLTIFAYVLLLWLLVRYRQSPGMKWAILLGICFGATSLLRAETLLYLAFFCCWVLVIKGRSLVSEDDQGKQLDEAQPFILSFKNRLVYAMVLGGLAGAVMLPWMIRNTLLYQKPTLLTISKGENLWQGNNQYASGLRREYAWPRPGQPGTPWPRDPDYQKELRALAQTPMRHLERDEISLKYALRDIKDSPERLPALAWRKVSFMWGYIWADDVYYPSMDHPAYWVPWLLIWPWMMLGWIMIIIKWRDGGIFTSWLLIQTLLAAVFISLPRYRFFIYPILAICAAYAVVVVITWLRKQFNKKPPVPVASNSQAEFHS